MHDTMHYTTCDIRSTKQTQNVQNVKQITITLYTVT